VSVYGPATNTEDYTDSLRTDAFYDRPIELVEADLDDEETALAIDLWAAEHIAEAQAEYWADVARDEAVDL
jgi:hypothetical protein